MRKRWINILALAPMAMAPAAAEAAFFASEVVATSAGARQDASFADTSLALGGPTGDKDLSKQSLDVYNLGRNGSITLGFTKDGQSRAMTNGPGEDFIVFENAFYQESPSYPEGDPTRSFAELMFVEVSSNGTDFARFTNDSNTANAVSGSLDPADVSGFAGVHPIEADVNANTVDPFDPDAAGGDAFDLASLSDHALVESGKLDLSNIQYVRLVDVFGDGSVTDSEGNPIYDPTLSSTNGADVDALSIINVLPEPGTAALVLLGGLGVLRRGRATRKA
jgi:hypothetical protein